MPFGQPEVWRPRGRGGDLYGWSRNLAGYLQVAMPGICGDDGPNAAGQLPSNKDGDGPSDIIKDIETANNVIASSVQCY